MLRGSSSHLWTVTAIEAEQKKAAMAARYGKTLCKVILRFAEKGKAAMNDKIVKLIRSNPLCEPAS